MLFQGIPESIVGTECVVFYMLLHEIPCYSKAFLSPLWVPRELIFRWYSTIFHAIPRHSWDPCGYGGSRFLYDILGYSMLFQGIPETLVGTKRVIVYMIFHNRPCYSKAFLSPLWVRRESIFPRYSRYSMLFQGMPWTLQGIDSVQFSTIFHDIPWYSKACHGPCRAPIPFIFLWYSTIFHAIPRHGLLCSKSLLLANSPGKSYYLK